MKMSTSHSPHSTERHQTDLNLCWFGATCQSFPSASPPFWASVFLVQRCGPGDEPETIWSHPVTALEIALFESLPDNSLSASHLPFSHKRLVRTGWRVASPLGCSSCWDNIGLRILLLWWLSRCFFHPVLRVLVTLWVFMGGLVLRLHHKQERSSQLSSHKAGPGRHLCTQRTAYFASVSILPLKVFLL